MSAPRDIWLEDFGHDGFAVHWFRSIRKTMVGTFVKYTLHSEYEALEVSRNNWRAAAENDTAIIKKLQQQVEALKEDADGKRAQQCRQAMLPAHPGSLQRGRLGGWRINPTNGSCNTTRRVQYYSHAIE